MRLRFFYSIAVLVIICCSEPCTASSQSDTATVNKLNAESSKMIDEGKFKEALAKAKRSLHISEENNYKSGMAEAYFNMAKSEDNLGSDSAIEHFNRAKKLYDDLGDKKGVIRCLSGIGFTSDRLSKYPDALKNYNQALDLSKKLNDQVEIAQALSDIGLIYNKQGDYTQAMNYYSQSMDALKAVNDKKGMSRAFNSMATTDIKMGKYTEAMQACYDGLRLIDTINDKGEWASLHFTLGVLNTQLQNYDEALRDHLEALRYYDQSGNSLEVAVSNNQVANVYNKKGDVNDALKYHLRALEIGKIYGSKKFVASCNDNIGRDYTSLGRNDQALSYHLQGLKLNREIGNRNATAKSYLNVGHSLNILGRSSVALDSLRNGLSLAKSIGASELVRDIDQQLSETFYRLHNLDSTYHYFNLYSSLKDSLLNADKIKSLNEMSVRYKTEEKDKEIKSMSLEKQVEEQKNEIALAGRKYIIIAIVSLLIILSVIFYEFTRRRRVRFAYETNLLKNRVLRTQLNPHFIFNALNSIRNFIQQHPKLADDYLTKFSTLMRQVLENSEEETISLSDEIAMLKNYMELESLRLPKGFDYEISFSESVDENNTMIPPLILQPLIENAIWHGLKPLTHRGKISLLFNEKDGLLESSIQDNGIGLGSTKVDTKTAEKKRSMGMQITRDRIELLNRKSKSKGSMVQQLFEVGSLVKIDIPLAN